MVDETVKTPGGTASGIRCAILGNIPHVFHKPGAETITVSKGPSSVAVALANPLHPGGIVVTQACGLADVCFAKKLSLSARAARRSRQKEKP